MKYGCIGEHLSHSYSTEIHALLGDYDYTLREVSKSDFDSFMKAADFCGINVTIPYKEAVIPYLSEISGDAEAIGAVNTVFCREGKLFGCNTDIYGLEKLIERTGISLGGRRVAVLGTGGTSKTAATLAKSKGAETVTVSRTPNDTQISYDTLYSIADTVDVIINTTPVGMYPQEDGEILDLSPFSRLTGVIDVIYNPLRTSLVRSARKRGVAAAGGLYMLVAQAARAAEIFFSNSEYTDKTEEIYRNILLSKQNIVLIGMPSCGKTTVGKRLAETCAKEFYDSDEIFVKRQGDISEFFSSHGESRFREIETGIIKELSQKRGAVIATGGGTVLNPKNTERLARNGVICFIDRPKEMLVASPDRPLSRSTSDIERLYADRIGLYRESADIILKADKTINAESAELIRMIERYNSESEVAHR